MAKEGRGRARASTEPVLRNAVVADGVRRFDDGIVNWYLVEDGQMLTAVDAGFPPAWEVVTATLRELDRSLGDLRAVAITHAHVDHIGFARSAREEAGARVYVHERDADLLRRPATMARSERGPLRYVGHAATRRLLAHAVRSRAPLAKGVADVRTFADGETLDVPGSPRVVFTPGHTDGHSCFHLPDRGVLFAGDALVTRDPYTGELGPRVVARAATKDSGQALASLDRLAELEAEVLLPGHGEPWRDGPAEAVRLARAAGAA